MNHNKRILIAGGSGFIGSQLTALLRKNGYGIGILSRKARDIPGVEVIRWNLEEQSIAGDISPYDIIINLNGAPINGKRWSDAYKKVLYDSRIKSARLIRNTLLRQDNKPELYIGASASGYYGDHGDRWITEQTEPNKDFLHNLTSDWEEAHSMPRLPGIRKVILRIGLVLSPEAGALEPLVKASKFGLYPVFGFGDFYQSWIHIDDICRMCLFAIRNAGVNGTYNAVAPEPVKNITLAKTLRAVSGRPGILAPAPKIALDLIVGEVANILFVSQRISPEKIEQAGFHFHFPNLEKALKDLLATEN